jgi:hypothetical protein
MMLCGSGFYISWYISLHSVQNSQRTIISNSAFNRSKVVQFIFSKNDLKKNTDFTFDGENEFEYKNQMYDVISRKNIGDSIYIICISDTEEDNLRDIAMSQIMSSGNNTTGKELPIFKFHLDRYTNDFKNINAGFLIKLTSNSYRQHKAGKLISPYLNTSSPPPWL